MSNEVRLSDIVAAYKHGMRGIPTTTHMSAETEAKIASVPALASDPPCDTDLSVQTAATDPMRVLCRLRCDECGHDWHQPAAGGLCPRCHSTDTRCTERRVCVNKRV